MSTTGRKPVPAEVRRKEGDRSHRPPVQPALVGGRVADEERITPPPNLSRHMRAIWLTVIADLRAGGVLDRADLVTVEAFAVAMGRTREIRAALRLIANAARAAAETETDPVRKLLGAAGLGHLLADAARGTQAQPLLSKEKEYLAEARQIGSDLGLSAVARTRLGLDAKGSLGPKSMPGELGRKIGPSPRLVASEGQAV